MGAIPINGQQQIIEIANSAYPMAVPVETLERYQLESIFNNSGYIVTRDGTAIYKGSIAASNAAGNQVIGNTAMQSKIVTDPGTGAKTLTTSDIPASTTTGGTSLLKGAMNIEVSPVMSALMIAQACGYMWDEVEEHPEFWTDVSDALLGFDQGGIAGNATPEALKLKNGLDVILRARTDGGVGAYCEKEKIRRAVNKMYDAGGFNTETDLKPDITQGGTYTVVPGGCDLGYAISSFGVPQPQTGVYEQFLAHFNARKENCNAMVVGCRVSTWDTGGFVNFLIDCYEVAPNTEMAFNYNNGNIYTNSRIPVYKISMEYEYDFYTGAFRGMSANRDGWYEYLNYYTNGTYGNYNIKSTINSTYVTPTGILEEDTAPGTIVIKNPSELETLLAAWMADGFTTDRVNPDTGENETVDWLPLNIFDFFNMPAQEPGQDYAQSGKLPGKDGDPSIFPDFILDYLVPNINFPNFQFPEQPTGDTPLPFVPTNSMSSKLYTVYNPSNANLDSLGAFMWNTSIIQQLVELFTNNPMDAIISLHQIYATPSTGADKNIILGVLDSNVPAPVVTNQYVVIDCGSVSVAEIYGDARDYTQVQTDIFLPFIGLRSLDCHDVIGCQVGVKFKIDVYTGSTLAEISVTKQGVTQILYTFEGNCSVQIPLTAADRSRMIQGIVAATTGLVTGGVGAMAGAAAAASLGGAMQTSIQKSSAFSGNAGAMGGKVPYIVVTRQKSADAVSYNTIIGNPTNKTVYLKDCHGFTRVKDIHIDIPRATAIEKEMLYGVLKSGIII